MTKRFLNRFAPSIALALAIVTSIGCTRFIRENTLETIKNDEAREKAEQPLKPKSGVAKITSTDAPKDMEFTFHVANPCDDTDDGPARPTSTSIFATNLKQAKKWILDGNDNQRITIPGAKEGDQPEVVQPGKCVAK